MRASNEIGVAFSGARLSFLNPKSFKGKNKFAFVPVGLTKDVWGANGKWVVLEKV